MINSLTLLSLLKPTISFVFNLKRIVHLITLPAVILFAVFIVLFFYPPFFLAQEVQPRIDINLYTLFLAFFSFVFVFVSVFLRVQRILFFEDEKNENRLFFWMKLDKFFFRYLFVCFKVGAFSLALSCFICFAIVAVVQKLMPLPESTWLYFIAGVLLLSPYFVIRFILLLPAEAAGRPLGWINSWRMTSRLNITMGLLLVLFSLTALVFSTSLYSMMLDLFGDSRVLSFVGNYFTMFSVLFAGIMQAAYIGYLFPLLDSKK